MIIYLLVMLISTALGSAPGQAIVVNKCSYPVYVFAVPSADGGYAEIDSTLQPGAVFSQPWTQLTNGNGWSIKLSKSPILARDILQYEYTWHNDGIIWYDLSCVDGNPWSNNWQVSSDGTNCHPRQTFYRYSTDDAYGMQDCPQEASITVTLCSSDSTADEPASSKTSSVAATSVAATKALAYTDGQFWVAEESPAPKVVCSTILTTTRSSHRRDTERRT